MLTQEKKGRHEGCGCELSCRPPPHQKKRAAMAGLRFYMRTPWPTPKTKRRRLEGCGLACELPCQPKPSKNRAPWGGCGFACLRTSMLCQKKKRTRKGEKQTATKVPGQLLTLDQCRLGSLRCVRCACFLGLCSFLLGFSSYRQGSSELDVSQCSAAHKERVASLRARVCGILITNDLAFFI